MVNNSTSSDAAPAAGHQSLLNHIQHHLGEGERELKGLRFKMKLTYWLMLTFSAAMLTTGILLIVLPAISFFRGNIEELTFGILAGAGLVGLGVLFAFRPMERIHTLMARFSYTTMVKDSFQYQVGIRLLGLDIEDRAALEEIARQIAQATRFSIDLGREEVPVAGPWV